MEESRKILVSAQRTTDESHQSSTGDNIVEKLIDELQLPSSLDDRRETNAVDEHRRHHHHHHESLDVERLENSFSVMRLQFKELIRERDGLRRINDSCNQELLSKENRIKQLTVENDELKEEIMALRDKIDDSVVQSNDFNENCLLEIFSYLSMNDMMQVKRVCKQWYQVSQQWFEQVQTLVYNDDVIEDARLELYEKYYKRKVYEKTCISGLNDFISILHSCGHHIKYYIADLCIKEEYPTEECKKFIFQWVPKLCNNIVNVKIYGNSGLYTSLNLKIMATHWKKLRRLEIGFIPQSGGKNFLKLLRNNKELETLKLSFDYQHAWNLNDEFFTCLPTKIKEIIIRNILIDDTQELSHFISASKNFTSLQLLELSRFIYLTDAVVEAIANIKSLTRLRLYRVSDNESERTLTPIANLKGLKSLDLSKNDDLNEDSIISIVKSCIQLEQLTICTGRWLTDKGIGTITKLKKLKCLAINATNVTTKSLIGLCGSLEVLQCSNLMINCSDIIEFLMKATKLRFLYLDYFCTHSSLTSDILQAANKIANERKNNILCITGRLEYPDFDAIETPYFKYFKSITDIPLEIFPGDIKDYINIMIDNIRMNLNK